MTIFSVFVVNRAGGLIYDYDSNNGRRVETEKTFSFPLEPLLKIFDERVVVSFGQRDGVKVGHTVLGINGVPAAGRQLEDGREILEVIANEENYPIAIKFGRPRLSTNEKIVLASMFHSLFAIGSQLSPEHKSSGIEVLETDVFKLCCSQTLTGVKFIVLADPKQSGIDLLLRKLYEIYGDFALKNPFYSIDMPIRCELFDSNLQLAIEQVDKLGFAGM